MRSRKGDWRDILAAHSLSLDFKKMWLSLVAVLCTFSLASIMASLHGWAVGPGPVASLGLFQGSRSLLFVLMRGEYVSVLRRFAPLLNPFHHGAAHFGLSVLFYFLLLSVWTYCGGAITRLAALEYGRDELPTLRDALEMVRARQKAYYFAPATPLIGVLLFALCNLAVGLVLSAFTALSALVPDIPVLEQILQAVFSVGIMATEILGAVPITVILGFLIVLGVVTFGLMLPAVSIGGKDAYDAWGSAYGYLLWGFNRFVGYSVLGLAVGALTVALAGALGELFIYLMHKSLSAGFVGGEIIHYSFPALMPLQEASYGAALASWVAVIIMMLARALVAAYAFSFFFSANTVVCLLLRKHLDRIELDDIYREEAEVAPEEQADSEGPEPEVPAGERNRESEQQEGG